MTIQINYKPDKGIVFNGIELNWEDNRQTIRHLLNDCHETSDSVTDLNQYYDGNPEFNIIQRRDIYKNFGGQENFFFFNYYKDDSFRDIEIHNGLDINIFNTRLNFDMDFEKVVSILKTISSDNNELSRGEYLFKDLKVVIADHESMGGDGNSLRYFYCSKNIEHLIDQ